MKAGISKGIVALGALVLLILIAGYGGRVHPVGDSIGVFRVYTCAALVALGALAIVLGRWKAGAPFVAIGAGVFLTLGFQPVGTGVDRAEASTGGHTYTVYQKNILFMNNRRPQLLRDIRARDADVVMLEEAHGRNRGVWGALQGDYETSLYCDFVGVGGVAVYARWPAIEGTEHCLWGSAIVQVEGPEGPLWVMATHLHWVWPYDNAEQVASLVPELAALEGPKIIAGDFNTVPWTTSFQDLASAAGVDRIGPTQVSIVKAHGALRVPIDHVLATGGQGRATLLPLLGSDHRGVWAEFTMSGF